MGVTDHMRKQVHGTERNGTDQFRVHYLTAEVEWENQRSSWSSSIAKVFGVSAIPLTISEVVDYLKDPPAEQVNSIPPVEPKAGEMYLFQGSGKVNALHVQKCRTSCVQFSAIHFIRTCSFGMRIYSCS